MAGDASAPQEMLDEEALEEDDTAKDQKAAPPLPTQL